MMYGIRSFAGNRPPQQRPTDTAGLRWQPETWPIAYAMVKTVRPNASETPTNPMPSVGNAAANTALPQPPRTSQRVPMNSATKRLDMAEFPFLELLDATLMGNAPDVYSCVPRVGNARLGARDCG